MTRDFKQNGVTADNGQYGISWVLGGIAVGLMAGAVAYALISEPDFSRILNFGSAGQTAEIEQQPPKTDIVDAQDDSSPSLQDEPVVDERPGFSYHAVLPQLALDVPVPAPREAAPEDIGDNDLPTVDLTEEATTAAPVENTVAAQTRYMFQLGAYQNKQQAVQMQNLAKQNGMNTRVEAATINGKTWYRVRLGPTDNLQVVDRWKQRLSSMGISPMMIRM